MTHPIAVTVDLDAIRRNVRTVRSRLAPGAALMAVVKADAYGHGMVPVARAALDAGATWLGVAHVESALTLRAAGLTAPILAWLHAPAGQDELTDAVTAGIDLSIGSTEMARRLDAAAAVAGRPARCHLKIDTGMGRNGVPASGARAFARDIAGLGHLRPVAAWSHLACADEDQATAAVTVDAQDAALTAAVTDLEAELGPLDLTHLANSAAALTRPDVHRDLVRLGIALYGYAPDGTDPAAWGLAPAMTVACEVALVKEVPAGATVSYGATWCAETDTTLALLPIGYADGLHRTASGGVTLRIEPADRPPDRSTDPPGDRPADRPADLSGDRPADRPTERPTERPGDRPADRPTERPTVRPAVPAPQRGRICMDQIVVELPAGADVRPGDRATVLGPGGPSAQDWADAAGTISYEILTSVSPRLTRRFVDRSVDQVADRSADRGVDPVAGRVADGVADRVVERSTVSASPEEQR